MAAYDQDERQNVFFFFFKQKTAYEMSIGDWSSDVCSSDLLSFRLSDGIARHRAFFNALRIPTLAVSLGEIGRASCRGKSVNRRVDLGGRRIIKKKKELDEEGLFVDDLVGGALKRYSGV